jgi:hypothetical protein
MTGALGCFIAGSMSPDGGSAQAPRWEVDLNGSRIAYDTMAALNAPSISSLAEWQRTSLFGRLSGSITGFEGAGWSAQGRGDLAGWLSPLGRLSPMRLEIGGALGGSRHSSGFDSYLARGDLRWHLRSRSAGAWVGSSLASARNSFDTASVTGVTPNGGLWIQNGPIRASLSYQHTRVSGDAYPEGNAAIAANRNRIDLTVYGGMRRSPYEGLDESWVGVAAAVWITPNAALLVSGGRYAADVLQALPGGRFASIGVRLTPRRTRPVPSLDLTPIVYSAEDARGGSIGFLIEGAAHVEIAGDWNGWQLTPLTRDGGGQWILPVDLHPGVYRFNVRVDGERWIVPEGVPEVDDGYGEQVGLLIIAKES